MRFANPHVLWLLLALPVLIVGLAYNYGWRRRITARLGHISQIRQLAGSVSPGRRLLKAILLTCGLALVILSLARPQAGERSTLAQRMGLDIVVALDFSKSMLAQDAYPNRLERAKAELNRLLDSLSGDRVGLVAFAGETLSYPLTVDYDAAKLFWRNMTPMDMPVGGTAIGKAIVAANRLLAGVRGSGPPRSQIMILLTDGEDHESEPLEAAKQAAKQGIRIFPVGIGSRSGEPIPMVNEDGTVAGYLSKPGGGFITTRLDEATLKTIAQTTKGQYIAMDPRRFGVEPILAQLRKFKRAESKTRLIRHYDEVFAWFLLPGFLLLLVETTMSDRRRQAAWPPPAIAHLTGKERRQ